MPPSGRRLGGPEGSRFRPSRVRQKKPTQRYAPFDVRLTRQMGRPPAERANGAQPFRDTSIGSAPRRRDDSWTRTRGRRWMAKVPAIGRHTGIPVRQAYDRSVCAMPTYLLLSWVPPKRGRATEGPAVLGS